MTDDYAHISAYKREDIYCNKAQLPSPAKVEKPNHLQNLVDQMPPLLAVPILSRLNPKLDADDIIYIGGRADAATDLTTWKKHPTIPKHSHLSYLMEQPE